MKYLGALCMMLGAAAVIYAQVIYRFAHPGLTETQLLLANPLWIVIGIVVALVGYWLLKDE